VGELLGSAGHDDVVDGTVRGRGARPGDAVVPAEPVHIAASYRFLGIETV
jgi:hypothetical protein